jgi:Zona pellucida-like domain
MFQPSTDVWEQDLSNAFNIDASTEGLQKVQLKCGADSMQIELVTKEDFTGVIYTRGSFYKHKAPCFMEGRGARSLTMKFPLGQCQTIQEGDVFSNVVVVQHDPELVTTGDAAFQVECDFRKPRSITVGADFQAKDAR